MITKMTGPEARNHTPTSQDFDELLPAMLALGWRWSQSRRHDFCKGGWWVNPAHPTKNRPVGDPRPFHYAAWLTFKTYIAPER